MSCNNNILPTNDGNVQWSPGSIKNAVNPNQAPCYGSGWSTNNSTTCVCPSTSCYTNVHVATNGTVSDHAYWCVKPKNANLNNWKPTYISGGTSGAPLL